MDQLVELALSARTVAHVDALESSLRAGGYTLERMLGDIDANYSTLANAADPRVLGPERVTNGVDAIIEYLLAQRGIDPTTLTSPQQAARLLLDIPARGVGELGKTERDRLGKLIEFTLWDSDDSRLKPTLGVRDFGMGIARPDAPATILSLHGSNKLRKPYLHGVYGQGGSLTLAHCEAAIYVTRKQPALLGINEPDLVTIAVVRAGDRADTRLPYYRYLVSDVDKLPYCCHADQTDFKPGTLVLHIDYDARRMGIHRWNQDTSVYAFMETLLYRPAMPYSLRDARTRDNQRPEDRGASVLAGLGPRLDTARTKKSDAIKKSKGPATLTIAGIGTVAVTWYLFVDQNRRRSYAASGYSAIFTQQGQVHHSWDKQRLQDLAG